MENILEHRARVGVPDAILLEDFKSEDSFIANLRRRYDENLIYTYIGQVLVSVNPYKDLQIYSEAHLEKYRKVSFYEVPPHVYAIAENAYRLMTEENQDECILISGESGAGKTEASKHVLRFIAASSLHRREGDRIRDRLLQSNPVLEGFGNAKTNRNDNSSRFGKYMDIECNFKGDPIGGHIINYLLEKSRVIHQEKGERNFHIFYQLLAGASDELLEKLNLKRAPEEYLYLRQGESSSVEQIDDKSCFSIVKSALKIIDFTDAEQNAMWSVIAAILHLGNVTYDCDQNGNSKIVNIDSVTYVSELLECNEDDLTQALTHRTIEARNDIVVVALKPDQAASARDALAKAIYERLFKWLVSRLNRSLQSEERGRSNLYGILDIYGFEIFDNNGFEQFCINYCNEKLQQVFIELTLRSEQEEYEKEGIQWELVEYFDNKIICDLVEEKHKGIISLMDEECLRPGEATDMTFLTKMDSHLANHKHYFSYQTSNNNYKLKKTINKDEFRLRHYAGEVAYCVKGFLDKNNDLLFRDLKSAMAYSNHNIVSQVFSKEELFQLKRPDTAVTQFKNSLAQLMRILMSKEPSYIRCIKPNDVKQPDNFNTERVRHQVQYLGLMENLRVRRAGFAYRRHYEIFLNRYKSLCPKTWPHYDGSAKDGVQELVKHLNYEDDEYRMGETKLFIRLPKTLFRTEDAFQRRKHELATMIQAIFKGKLQRRKYLLMVEAVTTITKNWKKVLAIRARKKRKWATIVVRKFINGYITRLDTTPNEDNAKFQKVVKHNWLLRLAKSLPSSVIKHSWPEAPKICMEASAYLKELHRTYLARNYVRNINPTKKVMFEEKILAESLFKGKKASYERCFPEWFKTSRLSTDEESLRKTAFEESIKLHGEKTKYCTPCTKYDRHGYKARDRLLILTSTALYLLEAKDNKVKQKHRLSLKEIIGILVSANSDGLMMIKIPPENAKKDKGDLILNIPNVIECVTKIISVNDNSEVLSIMTADSMNHSMKDGKQGTIILDTGRVSSINKNKEGKLVVVGGQ